MVAEEGEGVVDGGGSCWALGVAGRSLKIVGHVGGWGERLLLSWWSIMVPWASSWPWPVVGTGGTSQDAKVDL